MASPALHLPVLQQWDCHGCTNCCREYRVPVTEAERRRLIEQHWESDSDIGTLPILRRDGPWWSPRFRLNSHKNGDCVFLAPDGRCRIHARFGADAKPLACRLFPFLLVSAGDRWRVGLRFACPSATANNGRPLGEHRRELEGYATELRDQTATTGRPPLLQRGQELDWPDLLRFSRALLEMLREEQTPFERRMRKCLALGRLCQQANFEKIRGGRLAEFLNLVTTAVDQEVPAQNATVEPPGWVGRVLFRQSLALYVRKDHGQFRGPDLRGRLSLMRAALRFARGKGRVPRLHAEFPETTFEQMERPTGRPDPEADRVLERYYTVKVDSLQFCGPTNFGLPFWSGFTNLALTLPVIRWVARAFPELPPAESVRRAITMIDDHFGLNPLLGSRRQLIAAGLLAGAELDRLIVWYSR